MDTIKCNCGATATFNNPNKGCYIVGDVVASTGFAYVGLDDGGNIWLCPTCNEKAKELAAQLFKVTGSAWFYFPTLLPLENRER